MSAVQVAIARLALEKSVHIYCSSSAFLSGSHRQFRGNRKNLCFCQGPEKGKDPQLVVTTVTVNGFT